MNSHETRALETRRPFLECDALSDVIEREHGPSSKEEALHRMPHHALLCIGVLLEQTTFCTLCIVVSVDPFAPRTLTLPSFRVPHLFVAFLVVVFTLAAHVNVFVVLLLFARDENEFGFCPFQTSVGLRLPKIVGPCVTVFESTQPECMLRRFGRFIVQKDKCSLLVVRRVGNLHVQFVVNYRRYIRFHGSFPRVL